MARSGQPQIIDIPFTGGLADDVSPNLLPQGMFSALSNARQADTGEIRRRKGLQALAATTINTQPPDVSAVADIAAGAWVGGHRDGAELVMGDGDFAYAYSEDADQWVMRGLCDSFRVTRTLRVATGEISKADDDSESYGVACPSIAYAGGYYCVAWVQGYPNWGTANGFGYHWVAVIEASTGTVVFRERVPTGFSKGTGRSYALSISDTPKFIIVSDTGATTIVHHEITSISGNITLSGSTTLHSDVQSGVQIQAVAYSSTQWVLCYRNNSNEIKTIKYTDTTAAATDTETTANLEPIALHTKPDGTVFVVVSDGTKTRYYVVAADFASQAKSITTVDTVDSLDSVAAGVADVVDDPDDTADSLIIYNSPPTYDALHTNGRSAENAVFRRAVDSAYSFGTAAALAVKEVEIASRAYTQDSNTYIWLRNTKRTANQSDDYSTWLLCRFYNSTRAEPAIVAVLHPETCSPLQHALDYSSPGIEPRPMASDVISLGSNKWAVLVGVLEGGVSDAYGASVSLRIIEYDHSAYNHPRASLGESRIVGCGAAQHLAGTRCLPGFALRPNAPGLSEVSGSGSIAAGTYSVLQMWSWMDDAGNLHRSAPSDAASITISTGDTIRVIVQEPTVEIYDTAVQEFARKRGSTLEVYRTKDGGTTYYLALAKMDETIATGSTVDLVQADADIDEYPVLYDQGELTSTPLPAPHDLIADGLNMYAIEGSDRSRIWQSKPKQQGVAVEFADAMVLTVPGGGGNEALAAIDGRIICLQRKAIRELIGAPPDSAGSQRYVDSRPIHSPVGCGDRRSVAVIPEGVLFRSEANGWWLLNRSMSPRYVGGPVKAYDSDTVLGTVVLEDESEVRIALDSNTTLVYDYARGTWATYTYKDGDTNAAAIVSVGLWDNNYVALDTDGTVFVENRNTSNPYEDVAADDSGDKVTASLTTGWIRAGSMLGTHKISAISLLGRIVGDGSAATNDQITAKLYLDYNDHTSVETLSGAAVDSTTIDDPDANGDGPALIKFVPLYQECIALKVEISWVKENTYAVSGTGDLGFVATGLSVELVPRSELHELSDARSG